MELEVCFVFLDYENKLTFFFAVVLGCSAASFFASRFGRKPVLLGVLVIVMAGQTSVIISQILNHWLEFTFYLLWAVFQSIGNVSTTNFVVNMYIVDVSSAEERYFPSITRCHAF